MDEMNNVLELEPAELMIEELEDRSALEVHGACACTCTCGCTSSSCVVWF